MIRPRSAAPSFSLFLSAAVIFTIASFLIHEIYSFDVWWQITIGTDILDQLSIPQVDRYTAAALGRPYHDSHWLFQISLAGAHQLFGLIGVQLAMILVWVTTFWACYRACRHWASRELALVLLFVAAMACIERFLPRPEIITFMMIAVFYLRLQERQFNGWKNLFLFAALQIVWANCHGLFVIGPFLVGCYLIASLLKTGNSDETRSLIKLLLILLASTLVTPFAFKGWQYAALLVTEASPAANETLKTLGELSPVFGEAARSAPAFWFFLALLFCCSLLLILGVVRRKIAPARGLILLGLLAAALTGRRNIVLFSLVAAPFVAEQFSTLPQISLPGKKLFVILTSLVILSGSWFPLSGKYYLYVNQPARFGFGSTPSFFPYRLIDFLKASDFRGQVYNSNYLGGFYLYQRFPQARPLTDGRWEIYAPKEIEQIRYAPDSPALWQSLLGKYDIQGLLLSHNSPEAASLLPRISQSQTWKLVYFDYAASFWARSDLPLSKSEILLERATLPSPKRVEDCWLLNIFLGKVGAGKLQLTNLENALTFGWKTAQWLETKGQLEIKLKKYSAAEKTYSQLLEMHPQNFSALNELAFLKYIKGDKSSARQLLIRALKIEPENTKAAANLQRVQNAINTKRQP